MEGLREGDLTPISTSSTVTGLGDADGESDGLLEGEIDGLNDAESSPNSTSSIII